jgi:ubiquinone/menaquinone biosynthesis C-methylase UbiE
MKTTRYYDTLSGAYDRSRESPYHALVNGLTVEFAKSFILGRQILEVGCGTGLILSALQPLAAQAVGLDLSEGMLQVARKKELNVQRGDILSLPYRDEAFDVICCFKVLSHVEQLDGALKELNRVTRKEGWILADFYNARSLRACLKRLLPAREIVKGISEREVFTRYYRLREILKRLPPNLELVRTRGVSILTPAFAYEIPGLASIFRSLERRLCDSPLRFGGGFFLLALRKSA